MPLSPDRRRKELISSFVAAADCTPVRFTLRTALEADWLRYIASLFCFRLLFLGKLLPELSLVANPALFSQELSLELARSAPLPVNLVALSRKINARFQLVTFSAMPLQIH